MFDSVWNTICLGIISSVSSQTCAKVLRVRVLTKTFLVLAIKKSRLQSHSHRVVLVWKWIAPIQSESSSRAQRKSSYSGDMDENIPCFGNRQVMYRLDAEMNHSDSVRIVVQSTRKDKPHGRYYWWIHSLFPKSTNLDHNDKTSVAPPGFGGSLLLNELEIRLGGCQRAVWNFNSKKYQKACKLS
jgi:hypothetical protein